MTDDKSLPKPVRKRRQVEKAPALSPEAKLVKIADKIANVSDVVSSPPADRSLERRREYLEWTRAVVDGCRGANAELERCYRELIANGFELLEARGA